MLPSNSVHRCAGKTLSFLLPALSKLSYPPDAYPDDLKVRATGSPAVPPCNPWGLLQPGLLLGLRSSMLGIMPVAMHLWLHQSASLLP